MGTFLAVIMTAMITQFANTMYGEFHNKVKSLVTKPPTQPLLKTFKEPTALPSEGLAVVGMRRTSNGGYTAIDNRMANTGRVNLFHSARDHSSDNW